MWGTSKKALKWSAKPSFWECWHQDISEDISTTVTMRSGDWSVVHVFGHNAVLHTDEVDKLTKAGPQLSVVHKLQRRGHHKKISHAGGVTRGRE